MEADRAWSHAAEFAAEPTSAARARSWVRLRLLDHALPHLVQDLQLVVSELATNAMVHAATPFQVTLTGAADRSVLLEVLDGARPDPSKNAAQTLDTTRTWGRHRGRTQPGLGRHRSHGGRQVGCLARLPTARGTVGRSPTT